MLKFLNKHANCILLYDDIRIEKIGKCWRAMTYLTKEHEDVYFSRKTFRWAIRVDEYVYWNSLYELVIELDKNVMVKEYEYINPGD